MILSTYPGAAPPLQGSRHESGIGGPAFMEEDWRLDDGALRGIMGLRGERSVDVVTLRQARLAGRRPWRMAAAALVAASVLVTAGCSGDKGDSPSWQGGAGGDGKTASESPSPQPTLSTVAVTSPAADAKDVVASTEIKYDSEDAENTSVEVKDADGAEVTGVLDKDEKVFRPSQGAGLGQDLHGDGHRHTLGRQGRQREQHLHGDEEAVEAGAGDELPR
nr:hypothetical protein GCM10020092_094220 [Actinoplanes digitatis]